MSRASRPPRAASSPMSDSACVAAGHDDQADPHVEGPHHVVAGDAAALLQPPEDRRHFPRLTSITAAVPWGSTRGRLSGDAAAGDVRHALDAPAVEQRTHERQIRAVRLEQRLCQRSATARARSCPP